MKIVPVFAGMKIIAKSVPKTQPDRIREKYDKLNTKKQLSGQKS